MSDDADETRLLFGGNDDDEGEEGEGGEGSQNGDSSTSKHLFDQNRDWDRDRDQDDDPNGHPRMIWIGHARARVSRVDVSLPSLPFWGYTRWGRERAGMCTRLQP